MTEMMEKGCCSLRDRRKEIRKRIEKRKKYNRTYSTTTKMKNQQVYPEYHEQHDFAWYSTSDGMKNEGHPLFNKEAFLFKILVSACLLLVVAISFKNETEKFQPVRTAVTQVMEKEFQFATVANWYEKKFGKPLALFPEQVPKKEDEPSKYALPANGVILENFESDKQGVTIQTLKGASVEAIQSGVVEFAGVHEVYGNTVIVQHADQTQTWYGQLGGIKVKSYDKVKAGDEIGFVSTDGTGTTGEFYFAIKQDEKFIDPVQVIKFE